MAKKKVVKKRVSKVEKSFNSGTMTKAGFFGMIRSTLRQKSRWWKPIAEAKAKAKRAYKGENKRQKFEYQCAHCKNWFADKQVAIDHKIEAGTLTCFEDLAEFCKRLFCEVEGLQCLCDYGEGSCHYKKTQEYLKQQRENKKLA